MLLNSTDLLRVPRLTSNLLGTPARTSCRPLGTGIGMSDNLSKLKQRRFTGSFHVHFHILSIHRRNTYSLSQQCPLNAHRGLGTAAAAGDTVCERDRHSIQHPPLEHPPHTCFVRPAAWESPSLSLIHWWFSVQEPFVPQKARCRVYKLCCRCRGNATGI